MRGMVSAPQPEAVEVGVEILKRGGNAVDAAIACAFSQGVVDPQMCGIGGFGCLQVAMPKQGIHTTLEFLARAPLTATPDMWANHFIGQTRDGFAFLLDNLENDIGHRAVGTPGNVLGYCQALARFGTMDLADVMAPAIRQARSGFMVRPYVHYYWTMDQKAGGQANIEDKLRYSPSGQSIYFHANGNLKRPGDIVFNSDLARTLERIAQSGPDIFYRGEIADEIAADMQSWGGLLSRKDLEYYRVLEKGPVWGTYRGQKIASTAPPTGGVSLIETLQILDEFDLTELGHNSASHLRILAEAMKLMTIDREKFMGDPEFVDVPVEMLLSRARSSQHAEAIRSGAVAHIPRVEVTPEPPDTTVVCVLDGDGNAVTMTHTLGMPSGVIPSGLGFMLNGVMSGFDPRPGRAGSIAPGKARGSTMAPTITFKDGMPSAVLGAPGGTFIVPALAQTLSNVIDFGMTMQEAVSAPRIVCLSDKIDVCNRVPGATCDKLEEAGYSVVRSYQTFAFGAPHGVRTFDGGWQGGADPQRDGMALGTA